jgi:hypothetical protein
MSDILDHETTNTTKSASSITPIEPDKHATFEDVIDVIENYFMSQSRDKNKFYKDGKVHLIRDDFEIIPFMNTIHQMIESCIKTECQLDDVSASQVSEIFKAINSLTTVLKQTCTTTDVDYLFVIRLLSYCTSSYNKYNKSYVRSRKVQK